MILAKPRGTVAIAGQDLADGSHASGYQTVLAWIWRGELHNDARRSDVVVASSDQRGPRRRAHGGGVKVVLAQPLARNPVKGGRGNRTAKSRASAEANIIHHHQQNIWCAFGSCDLLRPVDRIGFPD